MNPSANTFELVEQKKDIEGHIASLSLSLETYEAHGDTLEVNRLQEDIEKAKQDLEAVEAAIQRSYWLD